MESFSWVAIRLVKTEGSFVQEKRDKEGRGRQLVHCLRAWIQEVITRMGRKGEYVRYSGT